MDPNANLKEQLQLARILLTGNYRLCKGVPAKYIEEDALRLAELVEALDAWLSGGGFLPAAWRIKK